LVGVAVKVIGFPEQMVVVLAVILISGVTLLTVILTLVLALSQPLTVWLT